MSRAFMKLPLTLGAIILAIALGLVWQSHRQIALAAGRLAKLVAA
ncbi:MAG: hypothetical protein RLZZ214_387 [Verrucomicrobiota bacterium]|jgi:cell division protein FtsL